MIVLGEVVNLQVKPSSIQAAVTVLYEAATLQADMMAAAQPPAPPHYLVFVGELAADSFSAFELLPGPGSRRLPAEEHERVKSACLAACVRRGMR